MRDVDQVRRVKERLKLKVKDQSWYRGIGIAPHADGPILRLNVAPDVEQGDLPDEFEGVPVEIVRAEGYLPRRD